MSQTRTRKLRMVKSLAPGHTAGERSSWDLILVWSSFSPDSPLVWGWVREKGRTLNIEDGCSKESAWREKINWGWSGPWPCCSNKAFCLFLSLEVLELIKKPKHGWPKIELVWQGVVQGRNQPRAKSIPTNKGISWAWSRMAPTLRASNIESREGRKRAGDVISDLGALKDQKEPGYS